MIPNYPRRAEDHVMSTESWESKQRTKDISASISKATIIGLRPASAYTFHLLARNRVGPGLPSNELHITTREAGKVSSGLLSSFSFSLTKSSLLLLLKDIG